MSYTLTFGMSEVAVRDWWAQFFKLSSSMTPRLCRGKGETASVLIMTFEEIGQKIHFTF